MSNMSYCRFRNTDKDLADCEDALEALYNSDGKLSEEELAAAQSLIERCARIVFNFMEAANRDVDRSLADIVDDMTGLTNFVGEDLADLNDEAEDTE